MQSGHSVRFYAYYTQSINNVWYSKSQHLGNKRIHEWYFIMIQIANKKARAFTLWFIQYRSLDKRSDSKRLDITRFHCSIRNFTMQVDNRQWQLQDTVMKIGFGKFNREINWQHCIFQRYSLDAVVEYFIVCIVLWLGKFLYFISSILKT